MDPKLTPLPPVEPTVLLVDSSPLIVAAQDQSANPAMNYQLIQAVRP